MRYPNVNKQIINAPFKYTLYKLFFTIQILD